jgi:Rieske Fe-S protein
MRDLKALTRRRFLRRTPAAIAAFIISLVATPLRSRKQRPILMRSTIDNLSDGVHLMDDAIVIKTPEQTKVLSRICTHLGCKLEAGQNGELHCPCHGSRFDYSGAVLEGPAETPLPRYRFDGKANAYVRTD